LPPEAQIALLRVLQEREFERVGGNQPILVDVRVLAATNKGPHRSPQGRWLRAALFYRLNVVPIQVPALRGSALVTFSLLVESIWSNDMLRGRQRFRRISKATLDLFEAYHWPGNIRELQNVIERQCPERRGCLSGGCQLADTGSGQVAVPGGALAANLVQREKAIIEAALARHTVSSAARPVLRQSLVSPDRPSNQRREARHRPVSLQIVIACGPPTVPSGDTVQHPRGCSRRTPNFGECQNYGPISALNSGY